MNESGACQQDGSIGTLQELVPPQKHWKPGIYCQNPHYQSSGKMVNDLWKLSKMLNWERPLNHGRRTLQSFNLSSPHSLYSVKQQSYMTAEFQVWLPGPRGSRPYSQGVVFVCFHPVCGFPKGWYMEIALFFLRVNFFKTEKQLYVGYLENNESQMKTPLPPGVKNNSWDKQ